MQPLNKKSSGSEVACCYRNISIICPSSFYLPITSNRKHWNGSQRSTVEEVRLANEALLLWNNFQWTSHPIASSAVYRFMTENVHVLHMFWMLVSSYVQLLNVDYQRTTDFSEATVTVIGKSWRYVVSVFHVTQTLLTNKLRSSSSKDLQARLLSTVTLQHSYRWHFAHPVGRPIFKLRPRNKFQKYANPPLWVTTKVHCPWAYYRGIMYFICIDRGEPSVVLVQHSEFCLVLVFN